MRVWGGSGEVEGKVETKETGDVAVSQVPVTLGSLEATTLLSKGVKAKYKLSE